MAFTSNSGGGPMAEINVTPLVDVMLVLLIIFMITAPLMSHKIRIDLPQANPNVQEQNPPEPIDLAVKESGEIFWNDELVTEAMLQAQLRVAAQKNPQPELQIRADKETQIPADRNRDGEREERRHGQDRIHHDLGGRRAVSSAPQTRLRRRCSNAAPFLFVRSVMARPFPLSRLRERVGVRAFGVKRVGCLCARWKREPRAPSPCPLPQAGEGKAVACAARASLARESRDSCGS